VTAASAAVVDFGGLECLHERSPARLHRDWAEVFAGGGHGMILLEFLGKVNEAVRCALISEDRVLQGASGAVLVQVGTVVTHSTLITRWTTESGHFIDFDVTCGGTQFAVFAVVDVHEISLLSLRSMSNVQVRLHLKNVQVQLHLWD
jgi:hypothetical protein